MENVVNVVRQENQESQGKLVGKVLEVNVVRAAQLDLQVNVVRKGCRASAEKLDRKVQPVLQVQPVPLEQLGRKVQLVQLAQ